MSDRVRPTVAFLAAAVVAAALFAIAYVLFVRGYAGQILDERAKLGAGATGVRLRPVADVALNLLPAVALGGGTVLVIVLGIVRRRIGATAVALAVVAGANVSTQLLKHVFLVRPETGATVPFYNSFPSGHMTVAAAAVLAVFIVCAPRARPWFAVIGAVVLIVVGVMLLGAQWHRPSDIVAAVLVVAAWGGVAGAVGVATGVLHRASRPVHGWGGLWWIAAGLVVVSAAAFAPVLASVSESGSNSHFAFVGGAAAIAACAVGSAAGFTRLFRRIA